MTINMKEVKLFASTGRLIKSISRSELPKELPEFILYAGNIFSKDFSDLSYSERTVYVYEEKPVTPKKEEPKEILKVTPGMFDTPLA